MSPTTRDADLPEPLRASRDADRTGHERLLVARHRDLVDEVISGYQRLDVPDHVVRSVAVEALVRAVEEYDANARVDFEEFARSVVQLAVAHRLICSRDPQTRLGSHDPQT